jgi:hypothetical protein
MQTATARIKATQVFLQHPSNDSVFEYIYVEVDQKTHVFPTQPQIRHQLRGVNRQYVFNHLKFNDNQVGNNQVYAVIAVERDTFVLNRKFDLTPKLDSAQIELMTKALFVCRFQ